jgi:hypothetical protein
MAVVKRYQRVAGSSPNVPPNVEEPSKIDWKAPAA